MREAAPQQEPGWTAEEEEAFARIHPWIGHGASLSIGARGVPLIKPFGYGGNHVTWRAPVIAASYDPSLCLKLAPDFVDSGLVRFSDDEVHYTAEEYRDKVRALAEAIESDIESILHEPIVVADLEGYDLDHWVAKAEKLGTTDPGWIVSRKPGGGIVPFAPSSNWADAGPILAREGISIIESRSNEDDASTVFWAAGYRPRAAAEWGAPGEGPDGFYVEMECEQSGATQLIAAMRAYLTRVHGEVIKP